MSSRHLVEKRLIFITDCVAEILSRIVERDLDGLLAFVRAIRDRLAT